MSSIPAFAFKAFAEDSHPEEEEPRLECFNAGISDEAIEQLSTGWFPKRPWPALSVILICAGIVPAGALVLATVLTLPFLSVEELGVHIPEPLLWTGLSGLALTALASWWGSYVTSGRCRAAKEWKQALGEAWLTHGGQVFVLKHLPKAIRTEVSEKLSVVEKIRKGLNRLDPQGDELDVVRYAMQRFIEASDIPLLSKRAADAPHILDPKVRQAAREYKTAVKNQELARRELEMSIGEAEDLLASRRQEKTDAEIIKLVNER